VKIRITLLLASLVLTAAAARGQVYGKDERKYTVVKPDLVALGAKKISSDGKTIKIEVSFRNSSSKAAGAFKVLAYCDWEPKPSEESTGSKFGGSTILVGYSVQSLAGKETRSYVIPCTQPDPKATRAILKVFVDSEEKVAELSETNNKYSTAFGLQ
jgi:subtilase family serine protease